MSRRDLNAIERAEEEMNNFDANTNDDDDGEQCCICLDQWTSFGSHRLASLPCGHLYGESCIRRWFFDVLNDCPLCMQRYHWASARALYAHRLRVVDRSALPRMQEELRNEKANTQRLSLDLSVSQVARDSFEDQILSLELDNDRMRELVPLSGAATKIAKNQSMIYPLQQQENYVDVGPYPGNRVMLYSSNHSTLMASTRRINGYGLRFIDSNTLQPNAFMQTSQLIVRDICLSDGEQNSVAVASREHHVKLFDLRSHQLCATFKGDQGRVWSCHLDAEARDNCIYLGDSRGGIIAHDMRKGGNGKLLAETTVCNYSPILQIAAIYPGRDFAKGGFLVCQETAIICYEYRDAITLTSTPQKLKVNGPFISMQYDPHRATVLISAEMRFIFGTLTKSEGMPHLDVKAYILGSNAMALNTRPSRFYTDSNTFLFGYLRHMKSLLVYDVQRDQRVQTLKTDETVFDMCPVTTSSGASYLAALSDEICRIYKINN